MYKLLNGFNKFSLLRQTKAENIIARCVQSYLLDNEDEEIVRTALGNFRTIGINIPDTKNLLTETALEKLHDCIKEFESDDDLRSAVLFGYGGNFCTGIVATNHAMELGQDLLKTLHTLKKPIIGALDGRTRGFGLKLAILCDMRVVEENAQVSLHQKEELEIPSFMYERLILTVGLSRTIELICTPNTWNANDCLSAGFANKIVETGSCLGQSMIWAQSIAFKNPLEKIIEQKSKILSALSKRNIE